MSDITGQENICCGGCGSTRPHVHYFGCPVIRYDTGDNNNTVTINKEDDMIEKAQDQHIRELETAVKRLEDFNCDLDREVEYLKEQISSDSVTEFKWVFHDDEQTSDLKKQISQLTYDNDILRKRIADILNIAKKDTQT